MDRVDCSLLPSLRSLDSSPSLAVPREYTTARPCPRHVEPFEIAPRALPDVREFLRVIDSRPCAKNIQPAAKSCWVWPLCLFSRAFWKRRFRPLHPPCVL